MNVRTLLRAAVVASGTAAVLAVASPVFAIVRDDGDDPGRQLNALQALLLYLGAPIGLFLLIALLVSAPSIARGPRYRPGLSWWAEPVWIGGPTGGPSRGPSGGAHHDHPAVATPAANIVSILSGVEPTRDGGGASARW